MRALMVVLGAGAVVVATSGGSVAQDKVQLTMLADVNDQLTAELWTGLFDEFTKEHPNITVTLVPTPSGEREDRAKTLLASGDFPDVQFPLPTVTFKDELLPFDLADPEISGQL